MSDHSHIHGVSYVDKALTISSPHADPSLAETWERIVIDQEVKERLLNQALLSISLRMNGLSSVALPLHGLILLSGAPGIGKTSLARGLASEVSAVLGDRYGHVRLVDVNLHLLPSELLGRTQRNIVQLFEEELPALAELGPIVVVLDEIEVLAVARAQVSLEINPADVFRGTAALLSALDWVSHHLPGAIVVGTTNLPDAVDSAMQSRADLILELPMPSVDVIRQILADTLGELARRFPSSAGSLGSAPEIEVVASLLEGLDGRQARKFVSEALAASRETVLDPSRLTLEQLLDQARRRSVVVGAARG